MINFVHEMPQSHHSSHISLLCAACDDDAVLVQRWKMISLKKEKKEEKKKEEEKVKIKWLSFLYSYDVEIILIR